MADGGGPRLVWLDDPAATGVELVGAKAANLAVSAGAGLPVIPGFVVTTRASAGLDGPGIAAALADDDEARRYWERLTDGGAHPLAVRSSSVAEDSETSSMAGQFLSVLHVTGGTPSSRRSARWWARPGSGPRPPAWPSSSSRWRRPAWAG